MLRAFLISSSVTLPATVTFDTAADLHRVSYTATSARAPFIYDVRLEVQTGAGNIGVTVWRVIVSPSAPSAATSAISTLGGAFAAATAGAVGVDLKDAFGNPWAKSLMPAGTPEADLVWTGR